MQHGGEGLVPGGHRAGLDQRVGDVRTADRGARLALALDVLPGDVEVRGQPPDHPLGPGQPVELGLLLLGQQRRVLRVVQVGEHVHADPPDLAGDLGPGQQGQAEPLGGLGGTGHPGGGVVVGEGDDVEPRGRGRLHHLARGAGTVRLAGMDVEIDAHAGQRRRGVSRPQGRSGSVSTLRASTRTNRFSRARAAELGQASTQSQTPEASPT